MRIEQPVIGEVPPERFEKPVAGGVHPERFEKPVAGGVIAPPGTEPERPLRPKEGQPPVARTDRVDISRSSERLRSAASEGAGSPKKLERLHREFSIRQYAVEPIQVSRSLIAELLEAGPPKTASNESAGS